MGSNPGKSDPRSQILEGLNPPQREAVQHRDGPLLVLAGAGSGKTRVITRRIAHLVAEGSSYESILAITFTNKAAGEMRDRTADLIGVRSPWIATFHSFAARVLRKHIYRLTPYDTSFTICDTEDCRSLVKELLKELGVDQDIWSPRSVLAEISHLKSSAEGDADTLGSDFRSGQVLRQIYLEYTERMRERNLLDFDDLLLLLVRLFREHPDILERYRKQFEYVLVDEYQDTNALQYTICRLLTLHAPNLCITGDPDQSIYAWRGADIRNILDFESDYPAAKVVKLEQNYRSTKNILFVANALISHNRDRKPKDLWTENEDGDPVHVAHFSHEHEESSHVATILREEIDKGTSLGDIAVFYRINSLSRVIEQELIYSNVPYQIVGGLEFFLRKEIKDSLSYLRVLSNPRDSESLKRVINSPPRGIGKSSIQKLEALAKEHGRGLLEVVLNEELRFTLNKRQNTAINAFRDIYNTLEGKKNGSVEELVRAVMIDTGYRDHLESSNQDDSEERLANLSELVGAAVEYDKNQSEGSLQDFLELTAILGDVDRWEKRNDRVSLMSIHSAKGLEFPVVIIIGVEEGVLPLMRTSEEPDIEEERRLLYVGVTRAQERLHLSHVATRMRFGRTTPCVPSRFIRELQPPRSEAGESFERLRMDLRTEQSLYQPRARPTFGRPSSDEWFDDSADQDPPGFEAEPSPIDVDHSPIDADPIAAEFASGQESFAEDSGFDDHFDMDEDPYPDGARVSHADYGQGQVIRSSGMGRMRRVTVRFDGGGEKQFLIAYANLSRVR